MHNRNEGRRGMRKSNAAGSRMDNGNASQGFEAYSRDAYGSGNNGAPVSGMKSALPETGKKKKRKDKDSDPLSYASYARNNGSYTKKQRKHGGTGKKVAIGILIAVLLSLIGAGVAVALYVNDLNNSMKAVDEQEAQEIGDALAPAVNDGPFYMVLIGADDREGVGGARSDTCILTRVDAKSATITMLSIPRDTAINLEGYGTQKFNAAYAYEGTSGTIKAASALCGVDVSHYAEVHFGDLVKLIDKMGGVEVDVPIEIDDKKAGGHIDAGKQTLNGKQALVFARSRSYANGDFQRTTSQRILVEACINKLLGMDPTKLPDLVKDLASCVQTDFNIVDLVSLANTMQNAEGGLKIYSALVPSTTAMVDGVSYVVCDTTTLEEMMKLTDAGEDPSKVAHDSTVTSSKEAKKAGISVIPKS